MKFNTNSNTYIIIYSVVMVVIVAVLLSLAALGLKDRQDANALNEKKTQIVKALGEDTATVAYDSVIAKAVILDASGAVVSEDVNEVFAALRGKQRRCSTSLWCRSLGSYLGLYRTRCRYEYR